MYKIVLIFNVLNRMLDSVLGSELALGKLIKKYFNLLQNYGFNFVKDVAFVKDCVQDHFI